MQNSDKAEATVRLMMRNLSGTACALLILSSSGAVLADAPIRLAQLYPSERMYPVYPGNPLPRSPALLPAEEVDALVRSLGLRPVGPPRIRGPVFLVDAVGQQGTLVRVVVDRRSGRVSEVMQLGHGAPRIARYPDHDEDALDDDDDVLVRPRDEVRGAPHERPARGPQIITREDIQSEPLPPPGRPGAGPAPIGPRVVTREDEFTGSVPPRGPSQPLGVDPLLGVPPEFRGQPSPAKGAKTASRPTPAPRAVPMPRPRPADSLARQDAPSLPPVDAPSRRDDPVGAGPPVQGFE